MTSREQHRLITERHQRDDSEDRKVLSKTRACLCCCLCLLIVVSIVIAIILLKKYLKFHPKGNENIADDFEETDISITEFPLNFTDYAIQNGRLCDTISVAASVKGINSPAQIYIIKGEHNLTDEQACGIESVLRLFPDKTIYLIDFNKAEMMFYNKCSSPPNYLALLLYLYKDRLELVFADRVEFFKNTPLQNFSNVDDNFNFMAMLLTAYKYGGFVVTPDVIMTTRDVIECSTEETVVEPFTIMASKQCDDFLHYLMQAFSTCGSRLNTSLDDILLQSVKLYSRNRYKNAVRRLRHDEVCSNVKQPCAFLKLREFKSGETQWIFDLSAFCKQVVQAFLGIKMNKIEVEEETHEIRSQIKDGGCKKGSHGRDENCDD